VLCYASEGFVWVLPSKSSANLLQENLLGLL
jgi:hypothetical protein